MKLKIVISYILLGALIISGCSSNESSLSQNTSSTTKLEESNAISSEKSEDSISEESSITTESSSSEKGIANWNNTKNEELIKFMNNFGKTLNQNYRELPKGTDVVINTYSLPSSLLNKTNGFTGISFNPDSPSETKTRDLIWYDESTRDSDSFNLLAVFKDDSLEHSSLETHLYLFTEHNNHPYTLHGNIKQGSYAGDPIIFNETKNKALIDGFREIYFGEKIEDIPVADTTIIDFDTAYNYLVENRQYWNYHDQNINESNVEVSNVNRRDHMLEKKQDAEGEYYTIVIDANQKPQGIMQNGMQFKVYTDGSIFQRFLSGTRDEFHKIK